MGGHEDVRFGEVYYITGKTVVVKVGAVGVLHDQLKVRLVNVEALIKKGK